MATLAGMNCLDWMLLALLAFAAVRGFFRGFVVEAASLVAVVLGIWAAARYNARLAEWTGLGQQHEVAAFLITFVLVLLLVHLLARAVTKAMELVQLGLPNKLAGVLFAVVRSAFILSVLLNLPGKTFTGTWLPASVTKGSMFYAPLQAFAPLALPAVANGKWIQGLWEKADDVREKLP